MSARVAITEKIAFLPIGPTFKVITIKIRRIHVIISGLDIVKHQTEWSEYTSGI